MCKDCERIFEDDDEKNYFFQCLKECEYCSKEFSVIQIMTHYEACPIRIISIPETPEQQYLEIILHVIQQRSQPIYVDVNNVINKRNGFGYVDTNNRNFKHHLDQKIDEYWKDENILITPEIFFKICNMYNVIYSIKIDNKVPFTNWIRPYFNYFEIYLFKFLRDHLYKIKINIIGNSLMVYNIIESIQNFNPKYFDEIKCN